VQPNLTDRLAFGDRALRAIVEAMPMIHFEPAKRPHLYAVTLHASIVQLCGGCLAMARTEHTAGIPVLLRSMFEALVDLDNLVRDPSYHERMDAANLDQFLKLLRASPTNPLMAGLDQKHDIPTITAELQAELHGLHARRRGQKDLRARCVDVGRENEYLSVYYLLCLDAHNTSMHPKLVARSLWAYVLDVLLAVPEAWSWLVAATNDGARRRRLTVGRDGA
jgi:hypothetical protein